MANQKQHAEARRVATRLHRGLAEDIRRLREDAAVSRTQLADAAGIDLSFLCRLEEGRERPSLDTYAKLSAALGADLSARFYPNTGPAIRDRHQARILEALLASLQPRWRAFPEVAVRRPSRGWIDVVLHDERSGSLVATEIQSDLRRLEQLLRWFPAKVASLPSWDGWGRLGPSPEPTRLLIVRSTAATRAIGREFARQLASDYPAHPADAIASLTGTARWPGPALVWAELEPTRVRFVSRRQAVV
ncbi:MAG: helix-turn-helix transcriptional regulator [Chloroflexi bacterium]|nr:helix-turn-helix transcriptional regulator [Chloroflexota bacterium]